MSHGNQFCGSGKSVWLTEEGESCEGVTSWPSLAVPGAEDREY